MILGHDINAESCTEKVVFPIISIPLMIQGKYLILVLIVMSCIVSLKNSPFEPLPPPVPQYVTEYKNRVFKEEIS